MKERVSNKRSEREREGGRGEIEGRRMGEKEEEGN